MNKIQCPLQGLALSRRYRLDGRRGGRIDGQMDTTHRYSMKKKDEWLSLVSWGKESNQDAKCNKEELKRLRL